MEKHEDLYEILKWKETEEMYERCDENPQYENFLYCGCITVEQGVRPPYGPPPLKYLCIYFINKDTARWVSQKHDVCMRALVFQQYNLVASLPWTLLEPILFAFVRSFKSLKLFSLLMELSLVGQVSSCLMNLVST